MLRLAIMMIVLLGLGVILPLQTNAEEIGDRLMYTGHQYSDPFASKRTSVELNPSPTKSKSTGEGITEEDVYRQYQVQGIVWNTNRHQAIINRRIVEVGDTVGDALIKSISEEGIKLDLFGKSYWLKRDQK